MLRPGRRGARVYGHTTTAMHKLSTPRPPRKRRNRTGTGEANSFYVVYGRSVMSAQMLEVSLLGVGPALRLERDAWSMVKRLRQATNEYAPPPPRAPSVSLPPISFRLAICPQVGWDIRVYLPTFIYIASHILGPFLLNPVVMRGYY